MVTEFHDFKFIRVRLLQVFNEKNYGKVRSTRIVFLYKKKKFAILIIQPKISIGFSSVSGRIQTCK